MATGYRPGHLEECPFCQQPMETVNELSHHLEKECEKAPREVDMRYLDSRRDLRSLAERTEVNLRE